MTFLNIRFPDDVRYGFTGGPVYNTETARGKTPDQDIHRSRRDAPVYEYATDLQRFGEDLELLLAFFRITRGSLHSFRFKDWIDYSAVDQPIGTGDGVETQFQLVKTYTSGSQSDTRIINKPVAGTVSIKLNGTPSSAWTLDEDTGIVTFTAAPLAAVAITASFEFDVQVRFAQDSLAVSRNHSAGYDALGIRLIEAFD